MRQTRLVTGTRWKDQTQIDADFTDYAEAPREGDLPSSSDGDEGTSRPGRYRLATND